MNLTVITPTYNEAENLPKLVSALFALPVRDLQILVVDDHSPDGTGEIADELAIQTSGRVAVIHRTGKMGLGSAYIQGFQRALEDGADAILQMDTDFSHPPEKIPEMVEALGGYDLVLGSRYVPGGKLDEQWPIWRKGLSAFGNLYARSILGIPIHDATGGFRLWRRETLSGIPLQRVRSNGYAFQVEMAYLACRLGYSYCEVPIYFADRRWGESKMSWRIQVEAAVRVWMMLVEYRSLPRRTSNIL